MKSLIVLFLTLGSTVAFADVGNFKYLKCNLTSASSLEVSVDLSDARKTVINGVQAQDAIDPATANEIGMAEVVKWNDEQVAISSDLAHLYIKDVASYSCVAAE